ncbi:T9SS type A sorting domain-containing protein [Psychroflexus tropicus]|uniref:T9SS type A sorting domain-containing protein n=1 Tax=Psychroflexus tropicus TaxID=197345 RepID=UPI000370A01B|nr:T9SS type A sorting domain-containing protein [Psychroflexus tropicus]
MKSFYLVLVFIAGMSLNTVAQQITLTSGGNAISSGGSLSFSIGQVSYNSYSSSSGQLSEGVQQSFEVSTLSVEKPIAAFSLAIYPNPTSKFISMDFKNQFEGGYHFKLFDMQGKLLIEQDVHNQNTRIDLREFASSTYILNLFKNNSIIQSFKILKH